MLIAFSAFLILVLATFCNRSGLQRWRLRSQQDWLLDAIGLITQGIIVPILQTIAIVRFYGWIFPIEAGILTIHPVISFLLSFIAIDYLYYWNHRLFHGQTFWSIHQVHHTVTEMDVLGTSRNTLWTSFLIVYLWANGLFIYLLHDPTFYLLGMSLTSALDLWRHSRFSPSDGGWLDRALSAWLMLPRDHRWHHAGGIESCNFGANFKLWDRLHGTYYSSNQTPQVLGIAIDLPLLRQLLFPFESE